MEAFELRSVSFSYPERRKKALDGLSLTVERGEFLVLCGPSGCGKTTLLRQLKSVLVPHGARTGEILFEGRPLDELDPREQAQRIGFVRQSPDNQIVTDKVWHELAFGLESLGYDSATIRRRVAEMASFFGIQGWFYKNVTELSGGQKQLLNLASVMVMQPDVLILDEPTSQLDPIAAADFLGAVGKINRELGTTVLLTEHRLEEAFPLATRVAVMDQGRLLCDGAPGEVGETLREKGHGMFLAMPTAMRVWAATNSGAPCPVTVREGKKWLAAFAQDHPLGPLPPEAGPVRGEENALECQGVWFKYEKDQPDVVKRLELTVKRGEFVTLLGENGTGKTTALKLLAGIVKPYRGEVRANGRVGVLPQDPQALFVKKTVREELYEALQGRGSSGDNMDERTAYVTALCQLSGLLDRHPYDLSGGEQQRAALAKVLLTEPEILLLDEPTKGLDAAFKQVFAGILHALLERGVSVVMVSHDIEFCAQYAHRCALFFDGGVVTQGTPREFFSGNRFYTTAANRMARQLLPQAVTARDMIAACGGQLPLEPEPPGDIPPMPVSAGRATEQKPKKLAWWRKLGAALSGGAALGLLLQLIGLVDFAALIGAGRGPSQLALYALLCAALVIFSACIARRRPRPERLSQVPGERRKASRRAVVATALVLLLIPFTLFGGVYYLGDRRYYFTALLILLEIMLPFFLMFEGRRPKARELVIIAALCAISVAGRAVFFMLPQFKPVIAMTIIAGVAFGGETGFLVGAVTMLVSNMMFAQGPWTPWQMFAMGMVGLLAGILFGRGRLRQSRESLCAFGALVTILVYGGIMNTSSALTWTQGLNFKILLTYYLSGLPFDCIQAVATGLFLWFGAEPFLEKLDRIKVKYGLVE